MAASKRIKHRGPASRNWKNDAAYAADRKRRMKRDPKGWNGSFGIEYLPANQMYAVLFSPRQDRSTASVIGMRKTKEAAESLAGWPAAKRKTKTRRSR